eukprot:SAG11_NODE_3998_length_2114_cov_1.231266_3_plen_180_part_00
MGFRRKSEFAPRLVGGGEAGWGGGEGGGNARVLSVAGGYCFSLAVVERVVDGAPCREGCAPAHPPSRASNCSATLPRQQLLRGAAPGAALCALLGAASHRRSPWGGGTGAWGINEKGQLGLGHRWIVDEPERLVALPPNLAQLAAGHQHSVAVLQVRALRWPAKAGRLTRPIDGRTAGV